MPSVEGTGTERRIVTVLFADLVGFTPLGERLDAEDVAAIQDAYFAAVRETVGRYGGSLEKFIGDAAVAAFGIPRTRDDDAERAVRAALAIVSAVSHLGARLGLEADELRVRCGIATGEVAHALGGPDAGRITGDTVNTAARLQAAAPPGGVLIGETTALTVADAVVLGPVEPLQLKGKAEPVRARTVLDVRPERSRDAAMGSLRAPTIGRDVEIAQLVEALGRITSSAGAEHWLVVAPPGIGKSRLLGEVVAAAGSAGVPVVTLRCRVEPEAPFTVVADLVRRLLETGGEADDPSTRARLAATGLDGGRLDVVADELGQLLGAEPGGGTGTREARFAAWLEGLDRLAGAGPHVWVIEDLHWASPDLLAFLAALADDRAPARLLVSTARPSLLGRASELAIDAPDLGRRLLELAPLPAGDAATLVRALVGDALPDDLVARIAARADGNPLFIEELLRVWISVGTLVAEEGTWHLAFTPDEIALPATVQAIYAAQIDDLPDDARGAARRGSVSGRRFPVDSLPVLEVEDLDAAVELLVRRAIIRPAADDPVTGATVAYRHALLRDAGYASLARAERALLHVRLARWLEHTAGDRVPAVAASIAGHWEAAVANASALATEVADGVDRRTARAIAARWLEEAARAATATGAHESARDLLRRSLAQTDPERPLDAARRQVRIGDAERMAGGLDAAVAAYAEATELAAPMLRGPVDGGGAIGGDVDVRRTFADAAARLADVRIELLAFEDAAVGTAEALALLGSAADGARVRVELQRNRALVALDNDYAAALLRAEALLGAARRDGDPELIRRAHAEHVGSLHEADQVTPDDWRAVSEAALAARDWPEAVSAGTNSAMLLLVTDPAAVRAAIEPLAATADAHRLTEAQCWLDYLRAEAGLVLGQWDEVTEAGERVLDVGIRWAYDRAVVRTMHAVVPVAARRGNAALLARAHAWFEERSGRFPSSPYGRLYRAAVDADFARAGLPARATPDMDDVRDGLRLREGGPSWLTALETVIASWLEHDDLAAAAEAVELIAPAAQSGGPAGRFVVAWLRARVGAATGRLSGEALAETSTRLAAEAAALAAPWWEAQAIRLAGTPAGAERAVTIERALGACPR